MRTRWSNITVSGFEAMLRPWMYRRLDGIYIAGVPRSLLREQRVVVVANHVSWWDGFLVREVQRMAGSRGPLLTLMNEKELRQRPLFRWMGVVGLDASSTSVRRATRTIRRFQQSGPLWLTCFPQGKIWPSWKRPLGFRRGAAFFAGLLAPALVLPVGLHLEMLRKPGPAAFAWVGEPQYVGLGDAPDIRDLENRVCDALENIYGLLAEHGESVADHWPSPFEQTSRREPVHGWQSS